MNVLHICQNYNTNLYHKAFETTSRGYRLQQVVFYPYITKQKHLRSDLFRVHAVKSVPALFRHFFMLRALVNYINLRKNVNLNSIDIIHCHTLFNDGAVGLLASIFSERRLIVSVRQSDYDIKRFKFWLQPFIFILKFKANKFIFISRQIEKKFNSIKGVIIGNGIDDEFFKEKTSKPNTPLTNPTRLVYIGRIIKRKNLDILIRALKYNERKLTVVGQAFPKTNWGLKLIDKFKNNNNINYIPKQTTLEIVQTLDTSDIFIMPSVNETFGIVYIEAMSRGVPIIYTKGTSVDEMFDSEVGVAIHEITPQAINQAIEKITSNYCYYSSNAINESQRFNWKEISKVTIEQYALNQGL
jgi:glycosyltransferase involved in cell wall biosynthesis